MENDGLFCSIGDHLDHSIRPEPLLNSNPDNLYKESSLLNVDELNKLVVTHTSFYRNGLGQRTLTVSEIGHCLDLSSLMTLGLKVDIFKNCCHTVYLEKY